MSESKKYFRQKKGQWIWIYDKDTNINRKVEIQIVIDALNEINKRNADPIKYFVLKKEREEYKKAYRKFLNNLNQ